MVTIDRQLFEEAVEDLKRLIKLEKMKVWPSEETLRSYNRELKKAMEILQCMK